jgi:hypothetical protein
VLQTKRILFLNVGALCAFVRNVDRRQLDSRLPAVAVDSQSWISFEHVATLRNRHPGRHRGILGLQPVVSISIHWHSRPL